MDQEKVWFALVTTSRICDSILVLVVALLSGCGGGPNGRGSGVGLSKYTISGTASGLSAAILLANNGTDKLLVSANGMFSFHNSIPVGSAYDVAIATQANNQFCLVSNGAGSAFADVTNVQVTCTTPSEQVLFNFGSLDSPTGGIIFDSGGAMYGTSSGGIKGRGQVFKLTFNNGHWMQTTLYSFCQLPICADGAGPTSGVVFDSAGNLYGTTNGGGAYGLGTVFELTPGLSGNSTESVLHSFGNGTDGSGLISGLVLDTSGNLYGSTFSGGTSSGCVEGCGIFFELSPNSGGGWTEQVLYSLCSNASSFCADGANPIGGVLLDTAGNLYGVTRNGGGNPAQFGTVVELSPSNGNQWTEKVLYAFQSGLDGANPNAGLTFDKLGNLYGTTAYGYCNGSACNNGTVFQLAQGSGAQWQERVLYGFMFGYDGIYPFGSLAVDKLGNLYGTTWQGGAIGTCGAVIGCGVIFGVTTGPSNAMWAETSMYSFPGGAGGTAPFSFLTLDTQGNLYGVVQSGGTNGAGLVYEVTP